MIAASCEEKTRAPNALKIAMHGVDLTLTATTPLTIKRAVLNASGRRKVRQRRTADQN
jgi:hypothetical protein